MRFEDIKVVLLSTAALFTLVTGFIIYFVVLYRNKQIQHKQEQEHLQSAFRQELLKAQIEMQEDTLIHISREIHDNITQVLSFVKLSMAMIAGAEEKQRIERINESRELVAQVINDLRDLSKSLSFEHITKFGLVKTIETETARINKSGLIKITLLIEGEIYTLGEQRELVLFRIFQEALNNTLKHSGARDLKISLQYMPEMFTLTLEDNGSGFSFSSLDNQGGSGLKNMENRATLIGAVATIASSQGKGCKINLALNPLEKRLFTDGTHPDSFS
ncbi:MAG: histidine kinase [Mucilaginibacter sp.]|nr:histidine kinase [Mucilaginibacter sp.]